MLDEHALLLQQGVDVSSSLEAIRMESIRQQEMVDGLWPGPADRTSETAALTARMRSHRLYSEELGSAMARLSSHPGLTMSLGPFESFVRFVEHEAIRFEEALRERGALVPENSNRINAHVQQVVQQITTRQQIRLELLKACKEMKLNSPVDLHPDIDRSFRKAIEELEEV